MRDLYRMEMAPPGEVQAITVPITLDPNEANNIMEYRVFVLGLSYVRVERVRVVFP